MKDFIAAGFVYVPAIFLGRYLAAHGCDPFFAGWVSASIAVLIRWHFSWSRA